LSAVDEFTCRVEVTGVACCLSDHMQQDPAQGAEPPAAKQVLRPPGWCAVKGSGGNDGVGKLYLPPLVRDEEAVRNHGETAASVEDCLDGSAAGRGLGPSEHADSL
jgi:hypothetical protein